MDLRRKLYVLASIGLLCYLFRLPNDGSDELQAAPVTTIPRAGLDIGENMREGAQAPAINCTESCTGRKLVVEPSQLLPRPTVGNLKLSDGYEVKTAGRNMAMEYLEAYGKSQKGEDAYALRNYFWGVRGGVVVESGALDGLRYSNSFVFSQLMQWRSVLVEASPDQYEKLVVNRPEAISINAALCQTPRRLHFLNTHPPATRGVFEFLDNNKKAKKYFIGKMRQKYGDSLEINGGFNETILDAELGLIPCVDFTSLMNGLGIEHVDLWFLDVEGAELIVLKGWDHNSIKVDVLVIEKRKGVIRHMQSIGYSCIDDATIDKYNYWCVSPTFKPQPYHG